jgi:hypothetical protein
VLVNNLYTTEPVRRRAMLERIAKATGFKAYELDLSAGLWSGSLAVDSMVHTSRRAVANFDLHEVCVRRGGVWGLCGPQKHVCIPAHMFMHACSLAHA